MSFSFLPADIVSQILNFGAPAPIDLQIRGADMKANFDYANKLLSKIRRIPGIADARIQQSPNAPTFNVDVDRTRAQYVGLTERDVTNSLVVNLAGSSQVAPTYYLNPDNGVSYSIVMQTPQYKMDSLSALQTLPITATGNLQAPMLGGIADVKRSTSSAVVSQYDIQSMVQIYATPQGRDLGAVAADVRAAMAETAKDVPKGSSVVLLGQVRDHEQRVLGPAVRAARRRRADLFADRGELPVLVRSVRDHHGAARGPGRHRLDAVHDADDAVGAGADRRHHVHGRRHRQQRAGDQLCPRTLRGTRRSRSRPRWKPASSASARC